MVPELSQSSSSPRSSAICIAPRPSERTPKPTQSKRELAWTLTFGIRNNSPSTATTPNGRLTKNT